MSSVVMKLSLRFRGRRVEPETTRLPVDYELTQELIRTKDWTRQAAGKTEQILVAGHQGICLSRQHQLQKDYVEGIPTGRRRRRQHPLSLPRLQQRRKPATRGGLFISCAWSWQLVSTRTRAGIGVSR